MMFFFLAGLLSSMVHADGFKSGSVFTANEYSGRVIVHCRGLDGRLEVANFDCSDYFLSPVEYDYFVTDRPEEATSVVLKRTLPSGKIRKKESKYLAQKQRSKDRFNLWIASMTQRPFLDVGLNTIDYELKSKDAVVKSGQFGVQVDVGADYRCQTEFINSNNDTDCRHPSSICTRYFQIANCAKDN